MERYFGSISTEQFENTSLREKKVTGNKSIGKNHRAGRKLGQSLIRQEEFEWGSPTAHSLCREVKEGPEGRRVTT